MYNWSSGKKGPYGSRAFGDTNRMECDLKLKSAVYDEDLFPHRSFRCLLDAGDDHDSAQNTSPVVESDHEMLQWDEATRKPRTPVRSPLKTCNQPLSDLFPGKSPLRTVNLSSSDLHHVRSTKTVTQTLVNASPARSAPKMQNQPITNLFPVVKRAPPVAHKPLLLGGNKPGKRDHSGRCISEALMKLSCSDDNGYPSPKRKNPELVVPRASESADIKADTFVRPPVPLKRSSSKNVIGDLTREHLLPTVRSRQADLKSISAATLTAVMSGELDSDEIEKLWIVDCRYPYEFTAGHVKGAVNAYHKEDLTKEFFDSLYVRQNPNKRVIVVFHCEFSSERGPYLARFMRNEDRKLHRQSYPYLAYPEIYLLDGGYKAFFEISKSLCDPPFYTPMTCEKHKDDLRRFKARARSFHDFSAALPERRPPVL